MACVGGEVLVARGFHVPFGLCEDTFGLLLGASSDLDELSEFLLLSAGGLYESYHLGLMDRILGEVLEDIERGQDRN